MTSPEARFRDAIDDPRVRASLVRQDPCLPVKPVSPTGFVGQLRQAVTNTTSLHLVEVSHMSCLYLFKLQ